MHTTSDLPSQEASLVLMQLRLGAIAGYTSSPAACMMSYSIGFALLQAQPEIDGSSLMWWCQPDDA